MCKKFNAIKDSGNSGNETKHEVGYNFDSSNIVKRSISETYAASKHVVKHPQAGLENKDCIILCKPKMDNFHFKDTVLETHLLNDVVVTDSEKCENDHISEKQHYTTQQELFVLIVTRRQA